MNLGDRRTDAVHVEGVLPTVPSERPADDPPLELGVEDRAGLLAAAASNTKVGDRRLSQRVTGHLAGTPRSYTSAVDCRPGRQSACDTQSRGLTEITRIIEPVIDVLSPEADVQRKGLGYP